jgi:hypothetical protein
VENFAFAARVEALDESGMLPNSSCSQYLASCPNGIKALTSFSKISSLSKFYRFIGYLLFRFLSFFIYLCKEINLSPKPKSDSMKYILICTLAALSFLNGFAQSGTTTVIYDGHGNVIGGSHIRIPQGVPVTRTDSASGNTFVLDSAHIIVSAYDKNGNVLWKTDPWKDNKIETYRTARPVIVDFRILPLDNRYSNRLPDGTTVLWIVYINTQFGFLDLKSGNFIFCGQD